MHRSLFFILVAVIALACSLPAQAGEDARDQPLIVVDDRAYPPFAFLDVARRFALRPATAG